MLDALIDTIAAAHDAKRHWDILTALWEQEVWFDTPRQRAAAQIARDALADAGLAEARLAPYPCDGRTRCQDWIMHLAWDCPAGRLTYADSGEVLADREKIPASIVYWSGPLASAGSPAAGEVVDGDAMEAIVPEAVAGKFVLTAKPPKEMKVRLVAAGAAPLAVVSDFLGENRGYDDDTVRWHNAWSDRPGDGWYFHADDTVMTGFSISPATGRKLRERLAGEGGLKLAGFCESRLYEGSGQNVTAVLAGTDPSHEIWIYGHACEQGAHDNTSGVSVLIESLRTLKGLIVAGKLPRPRHSIRMITTEECIGMVSFATLQDDARRRALAGMNVDGAGDAALPDYPFILHHGPLSNPTFAWAAAAVLAEIVKARAGESWHFRTKRFVNNADDMIADPNCNVPGLWLGKGGDCMGYHSSADTPERVISPDSLRNNTILTAAWAYAMASMDEKLAGAMIAPAARWVDENILNDGDDDPAALSRWVAGRILRDLARFGVGESVYGSAAAKYCPADAPPLPGLPTDGPRYCRTTWGTCTFETLPAEKRRGLSRWSGTLNSGLYWTDNVRPLAAVERLMRAETGAKGETNLAHLVEACLEAGLMVEDNSHKFEKH